MFPACRRAREQNENVSSFNAEVVLSDGSLLIAGYEADDVEFDRDFVAFKLDSSDGSVLQKWMASSDLLVHSEGRHSRRRSHRSACRH